MAQNPCAPDNIVIVPQSSPLSEADVVHGSKDSVGGHILR